MGIYAAQTFRHLLMRVLIQVIDFDWADSEGSAYYPADINMSPQCQWHKGVEPGGKIEMIHAVKFAIR